MENQEVDLTRVSRGQAGKVIAVAFIWLILIDNPSKFFIGLFVAPIDILASLIGLAVVPCLPSYLLARWLAPKMKWSTYKVWLIGAIVLLLMMSIGVIRSRFSI